MSGSGSNHPAADQTAGSARVRRRLLIAMLGVVAIMLVAQDVPLAGHLHDVERDRELSDLERDAFILAGQAAAVLRPQPSATEDAAESTAWALDILTSTITGHATPARTRASRWCDPTAP